MHKSHRFQQRIQLDPTDRAKQPHSAHYRRLQDSRFVLVHFQYYDFSGTGDASFVLSVSSRRSNPSGEHKDPKRVVPAGRGWITLAIEEGEDGSAGCQNCRLNMTRAPKVKLRDCNSPLHPTHSIDSSLLPPLPAGLPHRNPRTEHQTLELVR